MMISFPKGGTRSNAMQIKSATRSGTSFLWQGYHPIKGWIFVFTIASHFNSKLNDASNIDFKPILDINILTKYRLSPHICSKSYRMKYLLFAVPMFLVLGVYANKHQLPCWCLVSTFTLNIDSVSDTFLISKIRFFCGTFWEQIIKSKTCWRARLITWTPWTGHRELPWEGRAPTGSGWRSSWTEVQIRCLQLEN